MDKNPYKYVKKVLHKIKLCHNCDERCHENNMFHCTSCEHDFCTSCINHYSCVSCMNNFCEDCIEPHMYDEHINRLN